MAADRESPLASVMAMLREGVERVSGEKELKDYLNAVSSFHDYSPANCLLISMQKPDASLVAGYAAWKKRFGRIVRKGEKGIRIVAPCLRKKEITDGDGGRRVISVPSFRSVTVFDISQTAGRELPEYRIDLLKGGVRDFDTAMEILGEISPVPVYIEDTGDGRCGYCDMARGRIGISASMSEAQTVKTAVHEIAHAVLRGMSEERCSREISEIEAESVAYCVCRHFGLDTSDYSFRYIAAWKSMVKEDGMGSLARVREASSRLIDSISEKIREREDMALSPAEERPGDGYVR